MNRLNACLLILGSCALSACDGLFVECSTELRASLVVEVREAESGKAAARGATGHVRHLRSGVVTELYAALNDSLRLDGDWDTERAGRYEVVIRKPGYETESVLAVVDEDRCHVHTERVPVTLTRDRLAVAVVPIAFEPGSRVSGWEASAGITTFGDTLVVTGRAVALCGDLDVVAFRSREWWHIQFQPKQWEGTCPGVPGLQQFEARFKLEPGINHLLITHGHWRSETLFEGSVSRPGPFVQNGGGI